jgi:hypothetical protein
MTNACRLRGVAVAVALWSLSAWPAAAQAPALRPLNGIQELKSWFNANHDHPRVIFLLSPT